MGTAYKFGSATNNVEISNAGRMKFNGTALVWDDCRVVPGSFDFPGNADPNLASWQPGGSGATFKLYEFAPVDEVTIFVQLPHNYKEGTSLFCHVHWTPGLRGTAEDTKTVAWKADITKAGVDAAFAASATYDMTDTCDGTNHKHLMTPEAEISGSGLIVSSMLVGRLYRDAGDSWATNTAGNLPMILEFDIHYQIDDCGSAERLTKETP